MGMATPDLWQSSSSSESKTAASNHGAPMRRFWAARQMWDASEQESRGGLREAGILSPRGRDLKRALDLGFSFFALLVLWPLLLLLALAVRLDSPGPALYISERIGKGGRVFRCFKFRTMARNAESLRKAVVHLNERDKVLFKAKCDPRITRVGRILRKYSLDELPQFLNVLLGEMSVVGPRPPMTYEVMEYSVFELERLQALPGITGLWQVQGRHDPSFDTYVSLDLMYIENWSLGLDLRIMLRTLSVLLSGTGT
jgi:lipopolysaccharide/colanic/teichoic acid biosynthesis glycosyltransferase